MFTEKLTKVVDEGKLPLEVAEKYLTLYVGEADWSYHIGQVNARVKKEANSAEQMRRIIACATLLPVRERSVKIEPENPHTLLYTCSKFHQFQEQDWFKLYQEVVRKDLLIQDWRKQALSYGRIDPLEYAPYCRQAFNWLYGKAEESGCVTAENKEHIIRRFKNIVWAYGGACVSNIFLRHPEVLKSVANWRTGYFFERAIFEVYTVEQVLKIKKAELEKTNEKLVRGKFRLD